MTWISPYSPKFMTTSKPRLSECALCIWQGTLNVKCERCQLTWRDQRTRYNKEEWRYYRCRACGNLETPETLTKVLECPECENRDIVWGDYLEPPDKITAGTGKGEHMLKTEPATGGIFREVDVRGAGGGSGRGGRGGSTGSAGSDRFRLIMGFDSEILVLPIGGNDCIFKKHRAPRGGVTSLGVVEITT